MFCEAVCWYAPTLDLGKGATQTIHLGMSLYYTNTGIKKGPRKKSRYRVNTFSIVLPVHGLQNGVVSLAKEQQTLKHRRE